MRILHLEDSDNDAVLISEALSEEFSNCVVTRVETSSEFAEAMDHGDWDIILADYRLPSYDGTAALKLAIEKQPRVPFIFVTGFLGEELAVETLKNGATDYILKQRLNRLPQAVTRAIRERDSAAAKQKGEEALKDSLREKELLLQEVHHRVNNNLQIISSLLSMQAGDDDPRVASALSECQQRIQSMAMIHAMLYASTNLKDIDFAEYAHSLAAEVMQSHRVDPTRINLVLDLEPMRFGIGCAIACGLILNELLSNSIKYAFPNGRIGEVRVSLKQGEGDILLTVEDTGVEVFERHATGTSKSVRLGIVDALTKQLGGTMETATGHGARFALRFAQSTCSE